MRQTRVWLQKAAVRDKCVPRIAYLRSRPACRRRTAPGGDPLARRRPDRLRFRRRGGPIGRSGPGARGEPRADTRERPVPTTAHDHVLQPAPPRKAAWCGSERTIPAPVAQLDRVLASEAKGHRFESCRARHLPDDVPRTRGRTGRVRRSAADRSCAPPSPRSARTDNDLYLHGKVGIRIAGFGTVRAGLGGLCGAGGPGKAPGSADEVVPSVEPDIRWGQAAFGNVSLTALKLSTTMSLSSVPVSR